MEQAKRALREYFLRQRRERFNPLAAAAALASLLASPLWRQAAKIALYVPLPGEIDVTRLFANAWAEGKSLLLPRIRDKANKEMDFHEHGPDDTLLPGPFGLREPAATKSILMPDLMILPGLAFDARGMRLGYGGGYYDRYIARAGRAQTRIGLCQSCQIVPLLPADEWDMPLTALCCEEGFMWP